MGNHYSGRLIVTQAGWLVREDGKPLLCPIVDADGAPCDISEAHPDAEQKADLRRIAAAWNACVDFGTDDLFLLGACQDRVERLNRIARVADRMSEQP